MLIALLIALGVVGGSGLICALILVVASHFFNVAEDEKTTRIRECLPGVNCGACGYSGCNEYAKALANNQSEPNLCIPGSTQVANQLAEILGVSVSASKPKVAFVKCNGKCGEENQKAVYDGIRTCKASSQLYGGTFNCRFSCLGCGDCAAVCPTGAICMESGIAYVDPEACIGCGKCVKTCPKNIIILRPDDSAVSVMCSSRDTGAIARKACENACIGCKKCEKICPEGAITVNNNLAEIDFEKCKACGLCVGTCPVGCIKVTGITRALENNE